MLGGSGGGRGGDGTSGGGGGDGGSYGVTSGRVHISHSSASLQSGTVMLALRTALSQEMHLSPYRHCVGGGGGEQSPSHRGPSKALGAAFRKHDE